MMNYNPIIIVKPENVNMFLEDKRGMNEYEIMGIEGFMSELVRDSNFRNHTVYSNDALHIANVTYHLPSLPEFDDETASILNSYVPAYFFMFGHDGLMLVMFNDEEEKVHVRLS